MALIIQFQQGKGLDPCKKVEPYSTMLEVIIDLLTVTKVIKWATSSVIPSKDCRKIWTCSFWQQFTNCVHKLVHSKTVVDIVVSYCIKQWETALNTVFKNPHLANPDLGDSIIVFDSLNEDLINQNLITTINTFLRNKELLQDTCWRVEENAMVESQNELFYKNVIKVLLRCEERYHKLLLEIKKNGVKFSPTYVTIVSILNAKVTYKCLLQDLSSLFANTFTSFRTVQPHPFWVKSHYEDFKGLGFRYGMELDIELLVYQEPFRLITEWVANKTELTQQMVTQIILESVGIFIFSNMTNIIDKENNGIIPILLEEMTCFIIGCNYTRCQNITKLSLHVMWSDYYVPGIRYSNIIKDFKKKLIAELDDQNISYSNIFTSSNIIDIMQDIHPFFSKFQINLRQIPRNIWEDIICPYKLENNAPSKNKNTLEDFVDMNTQDLYPLPGSVKYKNNSYVAEKIPYALCRYSLKNKEKEILQVHSASPTFPPDVWYNHFPQRLDSNFKFPYETYFQQINDVKLAKASSEAWQHVKKKTRRHYN